MTTTAIATNEPHRGHDGASHYPWANRAVTIPDNVAGTTTTVHLGPEHTVQGVDCPLAVTVQADGDQRPYLFLDAFGHATTDAARDYAAALLHDIALAEGRDTDLCCAVSDNCPHVAHTEAAATADIARIRKHGNAGPLMARIAAAAHRRHNGHNKPGN